MDFTSRVLRGLAEFVSEHGAPNRITTAELHAHYVNLAPSKINRVGRKAAVWYLYEDGVAKWYAQYGGGDWVIEPFAPEHGRKVGQ